MTKHRELELAYLERVLAEHRIWQVVYTPLTGTSGAAVYRERPLWQTPEIEDIRAAVETMRQVVVLGDPGSGKTATLGRIAADVADRARTDSAAPLPVFVRLGDLRPGQSLEDHLRAELGGLGAHYPALMKDRRLALLLDGLQELPASNRAAWVRQVRDLAKRCQRERMVIVVTCRELDYTSELDLGIRQQVAIEPLDVFRILRFIKGYLQGSQTAAEDLFWEIAGDETAQVWQIYQRHGSFKFFWNGVPFDDEDGILTDEQTKFVYEARRGGRDLMRLAHNPAMLHLIIQMALENGGHLPKNLGALAHRLVKSLLLDRERLAPQTAEDLQTRLAALAYALSATGQANASLTRVDALRQLGDESLLNRARRAGILSGTDEIGFTNPFLQKFFVARWLNQAMRSGRPALDFWPADRSEAPAWLEAAAILMAGVYREDCSPVIGWLAEANPELAGRCAAQSGAHLPEPARNHWRTIWLRRMVNPEESLSVRAALGRALAGIGDPRPGVLAPGGVPDMVWCEVPAGPFRMGGDAQALYAWQGAEFDLPYAFWIARYPITYAQFEPFVAAGGYEEARYWTKIGTQDKQDRTEPRAYWNDPEWHIANHPVVGITWQEAYAYTQWLNEQAVTRPAGAPDNYVIRLARECEWEKAARYPDGRLLPWGNDYLPGYANIDETRRTQVGPNRLGRTTAVGLFPQGAHPAHGACDLSGNVLEWCLTVWAEKYQSPDAENNDPKSDAVRCCRGGSWFETAGFCRAAARFWHSPLLGERSLGLRVVLSIPIGDGHLESRKRAYADPYHEQKISRALSVLVKSRARDAFVIFRLKETNKAVQFIGSVREPLLFDLPLVKLNETELERARTLLGEEPHTIQSWANKGTMTARETMTFQRRLGRDIPAAAKLACAIFREVYRLPPDFELEIVQNP